MQSRLSDQSDQSDLSDPSDPSAEGLREEADLAVTPYTAGVRGEERPPEGLREEADLPPVSAVKT